MVMMFLPVPGDGECITVNTGECINQSPAEHYIVYNLILAIDKY